MIVQIKPSSKFSFPTIYLVTLRCLRSLKTQASTEARKSLTLNYLCSTTEKKKGDKEKIHRKKKIPKGDECPRYCQLDFLGLLFWAKSKRRVILLAFLSKSVICNSNNKHLIRVLWPSWTCPAYILTLLQVSNDYFENCRSCGNTNPNMSCVQGHISK